MGFNSGFKVLMGRLELVTKKMADMHLKSVN